MRPFSLVVALAFVAHPCAAFPPSYFEGRTASLTNRTIEGFSTEQLIDVSGAHSFKPPGDGDLRGPCPGLNAMANHNFIPHNGVVTITAAIAESEHVFGLGLDTATVAAVLALFGADLPALCGQTIM
ncbi:Chloroperoxidase [Mycena polygramma]|nr:Chloroperoxidase [Mycena polygramma]